jgi:hypothetical protein
MTNTWKTSRNSPLFDMDVIEIDCAPRVVAVGCHLKIEVGSVKGNYLLLGVIEEFIVLPYLQHVIAQNDHQPLQTDRPSNAVAVWPSLIVQGPLLPSSLETDDHPGLLARRDTDIFHLQPVRAFERAFYRCLWRQDYGCREIAPIDLIIPV